MKTLPIAGCRLPIEALFAGRSFTRRRHDGGEFICFNKERGQSFCGQDVGLNQQFEPQAGFARFFFDIADLGDEFCLTSRPATGAAIRRHGSAAADNLFGEGACRVIVFGNRPGQFNDSQGNGVSARFQFSRVHGMKLQTQSATGNRQPAISR
jgi:hypothetical protein